MQIDYVVLDDGTVWRRSYGSDALGTIYEWLIYGIAGVPVAWVLGLVACVVALPVAANAAARRAHAGDPRCGDRPHPPGADGRVQPGPLGGGSNRRGDPADRHLLRGTRGYRCHAHCARGAERQWCTVMQASGDDCRLL